MAVSPRATFMAKTILNFHFDYLTPSQYLNCIKKVPITYTHSHINQDDKGETKSTPLMSWALPNLTGSLGQKRQIIWTGKLT